jgi:hypothetical protein
MMLSKLNPVDMLSALGLFFIGMFLYRSFFVGSLERADYGLLIVGMHLALLIPVSVYMHSCADRDCGDD